MPSNNLNTILSKIQQYHPKYIDLKLDRMFRILNDLGNPHHSLPPTIHISGTNGKGSTIAFLRSMLENNGLLVHTYTSPHLVRFNERIRLNGKLISDDFLYKTLVKVDRINNGKEITFFEITTAAAFLAFSSIKADILLLEVGLGGRLDATNVLPNILASIITEISFDHEHFLGTTLTSITKEKCGIIKNNTPVFTINNKREIKKEIKKTSQKYGAEIFFIDKENFKINDKYFSFIFNQKEIHVPKPPLIGVHQLDNCALAVATLVLVSKKVDKIKLNKCFSGLKSTSWPARAQIVNNGKLIDKIINKKRIVMLDGAHNLSGAKALREALSKIDDNWILIFGYLRTRRPDEYLQEMHTISRNIITTRIPGDVDCYSPSELSKIAINKGFEISESNNIVEAIDIAQQSNLNVCVCGSLYLAGSFLSFNETIPN